MFPPKLLDNGKGAKDERHVFENVEADLLIEFRSGNCILLLLRRQGGEIHLRVWAGGAWASTPMAPCPSFVFWPSPNLVHVWEWGSGALY